MRCPHCQAPLPPKASFCRQCGKAVLKEAAELSERSAAGSATLVEGSLPAPPPRGENATMIDTGGLGTLPPPSETGDADYEGGGATLFDMGSLGISPADAQAVVQSGITEVELIGKNIGGYVIEKKLGEGGMGSVYKAVHTSGKPIAIKILHAEFAREPKVLERFFNEAKAVNKMNQPHIVDISDFGFLESGHPYIVMEFLDGMDLAGRLTEMCPLPEAEGIDITLQVLEALSAAHEVSVIHRDIKPENIFLLKHKKKPGRWFVKVLDFGIAKLSQASTQMTQSGTILGTPRYMSPEQARGEQKVGPGADIYSLGVILYELLVGRTPFDEPSYLGYLVAHQRKVPPLPREINPNITEEVEAVVMKCLEKAPNLRYESAKEMREVLAPCLEKALSSSPVPQPMAAPRAPSGGTLELSDAVEDAPPSPTPAPPPKEEPVKPPAAIMTSKIPVVQDPPAQPSGGAGKWVAIGVAAAAAAAVAVYFLAF